MAEFNSYPHFVADQVLTAKHLNTLFDYLDEQSRLTRNKLIGIGIACGMEVKIDAGKITIGKGVGVTSAGYLMAYEGGTYPYYGKSKYKFPDDFAEIDTQYGTSYNTWEAYPLLNTQKDATTDLEIKSNSAFLADKVVVLLLEKKSSALKNCTNNDCDDKGENVDFTLRPLLVTRNSLVKYSQSVSMSQRGSLPEVYLRRFNIPHKNISAPESLFKAFYSVAADDNTLSDLEKAYRKSYDVFSTYLSIVSPSNPFDDLKKYILETGKKMGQSENIIFAQYLYDWVDDLIRAYHEFRLVAEDVISECCPDEKAFPFHLMLREVVQDDENNLPVFRNYFVYSPLFDGFNHGKEQLLLYFRRMMHLVKNYAPPQLKASQKDDILVTPSRWGNAPLSARAIPYYYDPKPLHKYWNFEYSRYQQYNRNLSYHAADYSDIDAVINPLQYDVEANDFFRVEGHVGKRIADAYESILELKQSYNLPFDVVAVNLNASLINDKFITEQQLMCRYKDLESDFSRVIVDLLERLHRSVCFTTRVPYIAKQSLKNKKNVTNNPEFDKMDKTDCFTHSNTRNKYASFVYNKQKNGYKNGDFIKEIFTPQSNTVGKEFLHLQTMGASIPAPSSNAVNDFATAFYEHAFYFLQTIEDVLDALFSSGLSTLNYNAFARAIHIFEAFVNKVLKETIVLIAIKYKKQDGLDAATKTLVSETEFDVVVDELEKLLDMGIEEDVQSLYFELQKRYNQLLRELTFNSYSKNNTGLEHKAGVPRGGTLVLVYYYEARTETVGRKRESNQTWAIEKVTEDAKAAPEKKMMMVKKETDSIPEEVIDDTSAESRAYQFMQEIKTKYSHNLNNAKKEELDRMLDELKGEIEKTPTKRSGFNSLVLADFYLPYMCCGGCGSPVYESGKTQAPADNAPVTKVVELSRSVCYTEKMDLRSIIKEGLDNGSLDVIDKIISSGGLSIDGSTYMFTVAKPDSTQTYSVVYNSTSGNIIYEVHLSLKLIVVNAGFKLHVVGNKQDNRLDFKFSAMQQDTGNTYNFNAVYLNDAGTELDILDQDIHLVMTSPYDGIIKGFSFRYFQSLLLEKGIQVKDAQIRIKLKVQNKEGGCMDVKTSITFNRAYEKKNMSQLYNNGMDYII